MQAVMDDAVQVNRLRLALGASSAICLLCTGLIAAAFALYLGTGEALLLALPLPFLAPMLPSAFETFRLALNPQAAIRLERDGIRLGDNLLPYESIQWAELNGPAARPHVRFVCVSGARPPFRSLPFRGKAGGLPGFYDTSHLDFVQEINLRVRMAGNSGIC
jgi:hypothetical protein